LTGTCGNQYHHIKRFCSNISHLKLYLIKPYLNVKPWLYTSIVLLQYSRWYWRPFCLILGFHLYHTTLFVKFSENHDTCSYFVEQIRRHLFKLSKIVSYVLILLNRYTLICSNFGNRVICSYFVEQICRHLFKLSKILAHVHISKYYFINYKSSSPQHCWQRIWCIIIFGWWTKKALPNVKKSLKIPMDNTKP
jgi:hypothetical protein